MDHACKFFVTQVKADFEPISDADSEIGTVYRRIEYAYSACNLCGKALKTKVKTNVLD